MINRRSFLKAVAGCVGFVPFIGKGIASRISPRFDELLRQRSFPKSILIFGHCASGKTALAKRISFLNPCTVVDDGVQWTDPPTQFVDPFLFGTDLQKKRVALYRFLSEHSHTGTLVVTEHTTRPPYRCSRCDISAKPSVMLMFDLVFRTTRLDDGRIKVECVKNRYGVIGLEFYFRIQENLDLVEV